MSFTVRARPGYQNQHLIPQELKNHPVLKALGEDFNIHDNIHNRLELPTKAGVAAAENLAQFENFGEALHDGPHRAYSQYVGTILNALRDEYLTDERGNPITVLDDDARARLMAARRVASFGLSVAESLRFHSVDQTARA